MRKVSFKGFYIKTKLFFVSVSAVCLQSREIIETFVNPEFKKLNDLLFQSSVSQYYKYHNCWALICQRMAFIVSLIVYLESGILASHENVSKILGSNPINDFFFSF